jgi:hypothetical protein
MLDKATLLPTLMDKLARLPCGEAVDLRTYKRNRYVLIVKKDSDSFLIVENGFYQDRFLVSSSKLKKTLKVLIKREFPRSNKVRLYPLGPWDERSDPLPKRKKL